jgi:PAS domain S-box-containing protein
MHNNLSRTKLVLAWTIIVMAGVVAGFWSYRREHLENQKKLAADAARCALAFRSDEMEALAGSSADLDGVVYASVKERLMRLRAVEAGARFVSIFRYLPESSIVIFLADSEPVGSKYLSLPGARFPEASKMPGLRAILRNNQPVVGRPGWDSSGFFVTGYAVIGPTGMAAGLDSQRELLAISIPATDWNRQLLVSGLWTVVTVWLVLGLPWAAFTWIRQRSKSEALIRNLYEAVEQSGSAIMIVNLKSQIEYANAGLCKQTGYTRDELTGRPWQEIREGNTLPKEIAEIVARVRAGYPWEGLVSNRRKSGERYPARAIVTPVRRTDGKVAGFIAVFTDISEAQRKEEALRGAKEQAEAADHAKGRFLATMSHEVRTPLNGIVGFTNLLLDTAMTPEQREYVQTIRTSGEALIQLTGDILDFSRIESGRMQLEATPCDIRANVEDALDIFASRAADNGVQLLHSVDHDVPAQLMIDGGRLRQVVINLVGNAAKFTGAGEIEVTVRKLSGKSVSVAPFEDVTQGQLVAEFDDGGLTLEFAVRDTGIGISPSDCTKLFQPFTQLDSSNVRRYGGAGLGLAISRHLVHFMGGEIRVESELGRGSTFIFTVRARPVGPATDEFPMGRLEGRKVALVIRHPGLRIEIGHLMRLTGAKISEYSLDQLPSAQWDLAIVDCDDLMLDRLAAGEGDLKLRPERMFGLVAINLGAKERQALRCHFRMLLNRPVHHRTLLDLLVKASEGVSSRTASPLFTVASGLRVLVAEDEPVLQRLVTNTLTTLGCSCRFAENGRSCLEMVGTGIWDVIVMDLHMPEMDGLTAVKQIRTGEAGAANRDIWIIAITADHHAEIKEMTLAAGANDFLTKPISLPELEGALQRYLTARKTAAS